MVGHTKEEPKGRGSIRSGEDVSKILSQGELDGKKDGSEASPFQQFRDICESLVVALFLAFLFKTFEVEAFVIPTGSMAPTLKGRHKDVVCEQCHFRFQTSASEEIDSATNKRNGRRVVAGTCPQCGYTQYFGDDVPESGSDKNAPSFTGDRILVSKLTFDQREICRYDVSVFRSPAEPRINFIKRIVGFPNERLRVQYGDLFVQRADPTVDSLKDEKTVRFYDEPSSLSPDVDLALVGDVSNSSNIDSDDTIDDLPFEIQRKDYRRLRQMTQVVYDADYSVDTLEKLGWPERWGDDWNQSGVGFCGWVKTKLKKGVAFTFDGRKVASHDDRSSAIGVETAADVSPVADDDDSLAWLRYRHIVPSSDDWFYLSDGRLPPNVETTRVVANNPRLIDDFSAYNAGISRYARQNPATGVLAWFDSPEDEFSRLSIQKSDGDHRAFCRKNPDGFGCNWVGDLAVSCVLTLGKPSSEDDKIVFDLVKGGTVFRCVVLPVSGEIVLEIPGVSEFTPAKTSFHFLPGRDYEFEFYNVDEEMRVAVDGKELIFPNGGGRYDFLTESVDGNSPLPRNRDPNARDLAPVAIGARGVNASVRRLRVLRDVYYIAAGRGLEPWDSSSFTDFGSARCDRLARERVYLGDEGEAARFMSSPAMWRGYGNTKSALLRQRDGQYVAFGDNSGFSLDSRLWSTNTVPHYVDRKYLIGKAFFVYWPHGKPLPFIGSPFLPNFSDMRHID